MKASDNRLCVKFMQLEIGLLKIKIIENRCGFIFYIPNHLS